MLSSLRQLSHLDISASSFLTDAAMPFIAACSALRSLILSAGDPSAPRPAPLPVHGCGISDEGLGALASLTRLTTLCLRWNGHLGWKGVAKLSGLRDLHALDMGDTGIALEGAEEAAAGLRVLAGMDGLRSLAVPLLYSG